MSNEPIKLQTPIKLVLMAPGGYRKTSSLASLLNAGYNVRVLDFDNGIRALRENLSRPEYAKDCHSRLNWITLTEKMGVVSGKIRPTTAKVWNKLGDILTHWKHEDPEQGGAVDLGPVSEWGDKDVLVFDTISKCANAAMYFHQALNGRLASGATGNTYLRDIGAAQQLLDPLFQMLSSEDIKCNIIINAHVKFGKEDGSAPAQDEQAAMLLGHPKLIGSSAGPNLVTYFLDVLAMSKRGESYVICTRNQASYILKSSAPTKVKAEYPSATGLADYFKDLRS